MITFLTPFELAMNWTIDMVQAFSQIWGDISTPLFTIGDFEVSLLGMLSISLINVVIGFKIYQLVKPI